MSVASNRIEGIVQRRITKSYLGSSPLQIALKRPTYVETEAGGKVAGNPTTLDSQTFRLVPFKRRLTEMVRITQEGSLTQSTYALVGESDANIQEKDYFELDGCRYEVDSVEPKTPEFSFRTLAVLSFFGKPNP